MQDGELLDIFCTSKRLAYTLHLRFVGFYVLKKERVGNGKLNFQWFLRLQITLSGPLILFSINFFRPFANIVSNPFSAHSLYIYRKLYKLNNLFHLQADNKTQINRRINPYLSFSLKVSLVHFLKSVSGFIPPHIIC